MNEEEKERLSSQKSMLEFWKETMKLSQRFIKVMVDDEKNLAAALILDQIIKMFMLKTDFYYRQKEELELKSKDKCDNRIKLMKEACDERIRKMELIFKLKEERMAQTEREKDALIEQ